MVMKSDAKFKEKLTSGFKYDMRNLVNFHPTTQKSENFTSMGYFCPKYMRFELKKYRGVIFHDTEQWCKICKTVILWFQKWHEELGELSTWVEKWHKEFGSFLCEQLKVQKLALWLDPFVQSIQIFRWKSTEELCLMKLKSDAKFEEKLILDSKNDMRNLVDFNASSGKSENLHFDVLLLSKVYYIWPKKIQSCYVS